MQTCERISDAWLGAPRGAERAWLGVPVANEMDPGFNALEGEGGDKQP